MTDARDEVAVVTSESVARDPEVRPAPVKVRVVAVQTSAAREPKVESVLDENAQIDAGSEAASELDAEATTALVFALMTAASDVVAIPTRVSVLVLTALVIPDVCALVFALMFDASDVEAFSTVLLVFALTDAVPAAIDAASDVEALPTMVLVLVFTAEVIPDV
jgi:hypothetical protein